MTATDFLKQKNIIAQNKSDLIIGFDNDTQESLIELLESYHESKLKSIEYRCMSCEKDIESGSQLIFCKQCTE